MSIFTSSSYGRNVADNLSRLHTSNIGNMFSVPTILDQDPDQVIVKQLRLEYGDTVAIVGPKRTGKTLTATFLIRNRIANEPKSYLISNIAYNMELLGAEDRYIALDDVESISDLSDLHGRFILFIDELRRYADARFSQSKLSRFVSNLLADTGKQKVDFYYTDQDYGAVDKRVRLNVDVIVEPRYYEDNHMCIMLFWDDENKYKLFKNGYESWNPPMFNAGFWAPSFFKLFDTGQKIEDYEHKFKVRDHTLKISGWFDQYNKSYEKELMNLYCESEGVPLGSSEKDSILSFMKYFDPYDWLGYGKQDTVEMIKRSFS